MVIYYDQILKKEIISLPKYGCTNLHSALADQYRGCFSTAWTILNGEKFTGVTLHYIDESIDGGDIIAQRKVRIKNDDTGYSLYQKCTNTGVSLFKRFFPKLKLGLVPAKPQDKTKGRYYKREFPSQEIDFYKSGREIYNHIRAMLFEPFPAPYFYIGNEKYEIRKANKNA